MPETLMDMLAEAEELTKPSEAGLGHLSTLVQKLLGLQKQQEELAALSAQIGKDIAVLEEKEIPVLLDQLHLTGLDLADGRKLGIKKTYIGKIAPEREKEAFEWLETHGHGALIKTVVEAMFGMGQFEQAKELAEQLAETGYVVNATQAVHSGSLGKFVKEQLTAGHEIPQDLFNPMVLRRAKIG